MSNIWDQSVQVLRGRAGTLARIAVPALIVPTLVRDGWVAFLRPSGTLPQVSGSIIGGVLAIVTLALTAWAQLAITAVATDPATTAGDAAAQASRRFGPALGLYLVATVVAVLLIVPIIVALAGAGLDFAAIGRGVAPTIAPSRVGFVSIYLLVLGIVGIVLGIRLFLLTPVILNERVGLGAFGRSWSLTRGIAWRILGIYLLFALVWVVVQSAATLIVGLVARLIVGPDAAAVVTLAVALVGALATAAYIVVVAVFAAQLYAALSGRRAADIFA